MRIAILNRQACKPQRWALAAALLLAGLPGLATARPVLVVSIDGLRPADVIAAQARGLKLPTLTRLLATGAHARTVTGVLPTVTYPSHTTLLTGAAPARHGIAGNTTFDPEQRNFGGWYWYSADIQRTTLWEAAHAAHLSTGNVQWPVSVGAGGLDWNLPQLWRTGQGDDAKLVKALSTPGLVADLEADTGLALPGGIDERPEADEARGRFAEALIARHHPQFLTVYMTALDHAQHVFGPDSAEAKAVLERIDTAVGRVIAAERAAYPDAAVALVSDHGFAPTDTEISLYRAFIDAGLVAVDARGKITGWDAVPWNSGGSVAVVLARPDDAALRTRVARLLETLRADPANRIARIATRAQIAALGGNPAAEFIINLGPGMMSADYTPGGPLLAPSHYKGMHGYFPDDPRMMSTFVVAGPGIAAGRDLGEVDMRSIAPTLAMLLGVTLRQAELPALALAPPPG